MKTGFLSTGIRIGIAIFILGGLAWTGVAKRTIPLPLPSPTPTASPIVQSDVVPSTTALITKVVDGDTVTVQIQGVTQTVRLIGINAPESVDLAKPVECFGPEASAYLTQLLAGQTVSMSSDTTQQDRDHYNRLLRYIYLSNGVFVNEKMIREGYALEYTYDRPYAFQKDFREAQAEAQQQAVGLWASCTSTPDPNLEAEAPSAQP